MPSLLIFLVCVWLATFACSRKGWPLYLGLPAGIFLSVFAFALTFLFAAFAVKLGSVELGALIVAFRIYIAAMLTMLLAYLVPSTMQGKRQQLQNEVTTAPCPNCGRMNATTTKICPQCEYRRPSDEYVEIDGFGRPVIKKSLRNTL